jgi:hypothetical protein
MFPRTMRRFASSILLALVATAFLTSVADAREAIRGPGFRAYAPSGWQVQKFSGNGWRTETILPPGHVGRQRASALVSIAVAPVRTVQKAAGGSIRDKAKLVQRLITIPPGAAGVQPSLGPAPAVLHGKRGVIYGVSYNDAGYPTTHTATLVRRGKRFYLLQVITDPSLSALGDAAVQTIQNTWRWK